MVAANWKMHGQKDGVAALANTLVDELGTESSIDIVICPPFVYLPGINETFDGSRLTLGAQNLHQEPEGAFTGEVSGSMLRESGCRYVIVGHSERRELFGESDELVALKFKAAQAAGLNPILCLGETLEQREAGSTEEVVTRQLHAVLDASGIGAFTAAVIAYEPVWAIGTGRTATPEQAQAVHALIRRVLRQRDEQCAEGIRIIYGGSVKAANAGTLFAQPDIDGGLVGGASLKAEEFGRICRAAVTEFQQTGLK